MENHLLQSDIWEKYLKTEGKTTHILTDTDFYCLVEETTTPLGKYLYLPYGPALKTQKNSKSSQKTTQKSKKSANSAQNPQFPAQNTTTPQFLADRSTTTAQNSLQKAIKALYQLAKSQNAYFIRIEPSFPFKPADIASAAKKQHLTAKKSKNLDPEYTWVLDLQTTTEDDLLKNMESRKVRYWRNAQKKGITIRTSQNPADITILTNFLEKLGEKDNFTPQTKNHLKNQLKSGNFATLYIADYQEPEPQPQNNNPEPHKTPSHHQNDQKSKKSTPIAAALVYDFNGVRYYAHAATDFEHRKFQAGSILLIQMILDAKKAGAKIFDFWGITKSTDPNHPWYHFTQYKKSFGGREVPYSGTYDLILNPQKYRAYQLLRKANRLKRKIFK